MPYTAPITDRTFEDVVNRTPKAYFNRSDWTRIYRNAQLASSLAPLAGGDSAEFNPVAAPTAHTIPSVTSFNTLLANIERLRQSVSIPGTSVEIKDDWEAGPHKPSPTYQDVNLWESTIDAIWTYYAGDGLEVCPLLTADLIITTGTEVIIDCLNTGVYNVDLDGTAHLAII